MAPSLLRMAGVRPGSPTSARNFAVAVGTPTPRQEFLVGVEHEYEVSDAAGKRVDFRELIHTLTIDGRRLDPGDTNAYRLASGLALTADEQEAEIATPPVPVRRGFGDEIDALALLGRGSLHASLPVGYVTRGYSTHISVSVSGVDGDSLAQRYALTFGPAFAALADSPGSLGIYVRPRPGRLELCCDFVSGERLAMACVFAAGTVRACVDAAMHGSVRGLPPPLAAKLLPAHERYGYRLHRTASFGFDTYASGRATVLPLAAGGTVTLGERIAEGWRVTERMLGSALDATSRRTGRRLASGNLRLGVDDAPNGARGVRHEPGAVPPQPIDCYDRPAFRVTPVLATWDFSVFRFEGQRTVYANVPRWALQDFNRKLQTGKLDAVVAEYLSARSVRRVLAQRSETALPGLFDQLTNTPADLLPRERPPAGVAGVRPGKAMESTRQGKLPGRPGKRPVAEAGQARAVPQARLPRPAEARQPTPAPGPAWLFPGGALVAALLAAVLTMTLATNGNGDGDPGRTPSPVFSAVGGRMTPSPLATSPANSFETATPSRSSTAMVVVTATEGPSVVAPVVSPPSQGSTPVPPTATQPGAATETPEGTATPRPTETPNPTATVRPTETPNPTATVRPTETPRPTAVPTATPTRSIDPTTSPTIQPSGTPKAGCTPSAGVACPPGALPVT